MSAGFTRGPWARTGCRVDGDEQIICFAHLMRRADYEDGCREAEANARLIAAAPDHALICWAMCVQDGRWEEWTPYDGSGEFVFAGLRYATRIDEFGCPRLTPALREAITQSQARGEQVSA